MALLVKNLLANAGGAGDAGSISGSSGKMPWRRKWQPTPALLPGKFHGQRNLVNYSPWVRKESGTTERRHFTSLHFTLRSIEIKLNWIKILDGNVVFVVGYRIWLLPFRLLSSAFPLAKSYSVFISSPLWIYPDRFTLASVTSLQDQVFTFLVTLSINPVSVCFLGSVAQLCPTVWDLVDCHTVTAARLLCP